SRPLPARLAGRHRFRAGREPRARGPLRPRARRSRHRRPTRRARRRAPALVLRRGPGAGDAAGGLAGGQRDAHGRRRRQRARRRGQAGLGPVRAPRRLAETARLDRSELRGMAVTSSKRAPRLGAVTCPSCGKELPGEFPFCPFCGAALGAGPAAGREERKVVTVIFVDLVGFTARSEMLDPEDVRALLGPYHARLRADLERHGGTVEKFIGDAVMALFGAPIAREDDPERAVRAALAIRAWAEEQGNELQVRIGVNTGEALVALDVRPSEGETMASGDVVNTAARLQAAAALNGILVGEHTYRATADAIVYREAEPVTAKG